MLAVTFAGVDWSNTINLGAALIAALLGMMALGGAWYVVRRKGRIEGLADDVARWKDTAARWETERDAAESKAQRLVLELADEKIRCAKETADVLEQQRELRHDLKNQLQAALLEATTWKQKGDQTQVFEGMQQILAKMTDAEQSGISKVAQLLEAMEERAANRDAALVATQQEIVATLNRMADRITGQVTQAVGEVVQKKVDELNPDIPSPDRT